MTLVLAALGKDTIWMLADRRLSIGGRPAKEDARKLMTLETRDGVAILGYAGLGATALGIEPADWMSAVLRGRRVPMEMALGEIASAMTRQFPRHLAHVDRRYEATHSIIVPTFINERAHLYNIAMALSPDRRHFAFRFTRFVTQFIDSRGQIATPLCIGGSGVQALTKDVSWKRQILRLVKAHDQKKVSANVVADYMSRLNARVSSTIHDGSVGQRCIVVWRYRKKGIYGGGGSHRSYTGEIFDRSSPILPSICDGFEVQTLVSGIIPHFLKAAQSHFAGNKVEIDTDLINTALAKLPHEPDDKLR